MTTYLRFIPFSLAKQDPHRKPNDILKYSGMAFEMAAFIGVGLFLGNRLDRWADSSKPYFTIVLLLLFISLYFVRLIKDLNRK